MAKKLILKDIQSESKLIKRRVYLVVPLIFLMILIVLGRVFYLSILEHQHYTTLSKSNRLKITPLPPIRGLIYSRDGVVLAENRLSFNLEIVPEKIKDIDALITQLSNIILIEDSDVIRFKELIDKKRRFESIPLRFDLNEQEVALYAVHQHQFSGVHVVASPHRYYPYKDVLAHAIGYVGRIDEEDIQQFDEPSNYSGSNHTGKLGVEKSYEYILHGKVGYQRVEVNAAGRVIRILEKKAPQSGKNIHLTIDLSLQQIAVNELDQRRGAIVAMDVTNGDILAFASSPSYDPNLFVNGIGTQAYQNLFTSADKPLLNRVTQGEYPPGSTIKPLLGLIGLAHGVIDMEDEIWCPGWFSLKGDQRRYRDWKKEGHGHTNLHKAITESCDVYFYILAHELGISTIAEGLSRFGLGVMTGIDIGEESKGLLPSDTWKRHVLGQTWFPGETLIAGIGQGYILTTPLQLVKATAILANKGEVVRPRLVSGVSDPMTKKVTLLPSDAGEVVKLREQYWDDIILSMKDVVHGAHGTARFSSQGADYTFAGKTGTAQVISIAQDEEYKEEDIREELRDHALFIAFAPVISPTIAIAIIIENGGSGSKTAAPIARRMLDDYINATDAK